MPLINFLTFLLSIIGVSSVNVTPFISDSQDANIAELPFVVSPLNVSLAVQY